MSLNIFLCANCHMALNFNQPCLCESCRALLIRAPSLCPDCGAPENSNFHLEHSEREPQTLIQGYYSAWLSVGSTHKILKKWKITRGLLLSRELLNSSFPAFQSLRDLKPDWILPVPQHRLRSYHLRGSPSFEIANWLSRSIKTPVLCALNERSLTPPSQMGPKNRNERIHASKHAIHSRYELNSLSKHLRNKKIVIVDDWMTTGLTLRRVAQTLVPYAPKQIIAFTLSVRPRLNAQLNPVAHRY